MINGVSGLTMKVKQSLYSDASPFQKIEVLETYAYGRVMLLGGMIIFTERDEHIYNEMMTHPAMLATPAPVNICIIGGGDGGALREALKHDTVDRVTVVEIDRMVTETVRRFFPDLGSSFDDPRVELVFQDGHAFLEQSSRQYDCIIVDSYDPCGPVQSLETGNFYELVKGALKPDGAVAVQTDAPELYREKVESTVRDLRALFPWTAPFIAAIPSFPTGVCSYLLCAQSESGRADPDQGRVASIADACRYYSRQIQTGAFCLPKSLQRIFAVSD